MKITRTSHNIEVVQLEQDILKQFKAQEDFPSPPVEPLKAFNNVSRFQGVTSPIDGTDMAMLDGSDQTAELSKYVLSCTPEDFINWKVGHTEHEGDAFLVADLAVVDRQLEKWRRLLPRIEPFYAIKCNPDPMVLKKMVSLGIGFDCASRTEIDTMLSLGADPAKIIYANPCKQASYIKHAAKVDVKMMTFDNKEELYKISRFFPNAKLVLRIITDDSGAVCRLSAKFGASLDVTHDLLKLAKELNLDVIGVSFHVGSGCMSAKAFKDAVISARAVFDQAASVGYEMTLLDVGGGFPGNSGAAVTFDDVATVLGDVVDELFPKNVRVIAEPGRYFVAAAFHLVVNVTARRTVPLEDGQTSYMYYVNDGVYGSFNCILFDHAVVTPAVLTCYGEPVKDESTLSRCRSSVWGPTCDSIDLINKETYLPQLDVGDWLLYKEMGAYTCCASSTFNGFSKTCVFYTHSQ